MSKSGWIALRWFTTSAKSRVVLYLQRLGGRSGYAIGCCGFCVSWTSSAECLNHNFCQANSQHQLMMECSGMTSRQRFRRTSQANLRTHDCAGHSSDQTYVCLKPCNINCTIRHSVFICNKRNNNKKTTIWQKLSRISLMKRGTFYVMM